ncbi:hypothetical protein SKA34_05015 [Photobacterium sp. SKA34]|uniref:DUF2975 domain-containing protein n=1 Tax=Photobacterium sp. SKA34 TaxID=121723 RepID=UPI00006BA390|nr:DUF2975 domain-containing protein [Photobacterium sp. SKA34]EAR56813.1 hypothetical protein SKA34_05015 [Photobacterium sp. SKA34]
MSNIQKQSKRARILFQLFLVLTPVLVCYFWLTIDTPYDYLTNTGIIQTSFDDLHNITQVPLTLTTRLIATLTSLIYCSIIMYALTKLIRLFRNYENNNIFTLENATIYQKLGYSIFYWVGGSVFYQAIMTLVLSFNNPPGQRMIAFSFVGVDFITIIMGLIVLIISWVMKEAYILADEQHLTI